MERAGGALQWVTTFQREVVSAVTEDRKPHGSQKEPPLHGAFVSVMLVAGFIVLSWFGVFALFLSRG